MIDVQMLIYDKLMSNALIAEHCNERIKFYSYPSSADEQKPFVIIDPVDVSEPKGHASNVNHYRQYTYQINVETTNRLLTKQLQQAIRKEMYSLGFGQLAQGLDEFFDATKRFVMANRYEGTIKSDEWSV